MPGEHHDLSEAAGTIHVGGPDHTCELQRGCGPQPQVPPAPRTPHRALTEMTVRSSSRPSNQAWSILFLSSSFKDSAKTGCTKTSSLAPERQASGLLLHAKLLPVHRGVGGHIPSHRPSQVGGCHTNNGLA